MTPLQHERLAIATVSLMLRQGPTIVQLLVAQLELEYPGDLTDFDRSETNLLIEQLCNVGVGALEAWLKPPAEDPAPSLSDEELPGLEEIEVGLGDDPTILSHGPGPYDDPEPPCPHEWDADDTCRLCYVSRAI